MFGADGTFIALPAESEALLAAGFRRAVLEFLSANEALSEEMCAKMLGWRHCGRFFAHNQVPVAGDDREDRMKLAGYMIRAPMSLEKMSYDDRRKSLWDAATSTVIYRSKMPLGRKRNFQVIPGAQWLEPLCKHIPDRREHLVRYVGWHSNRARGERAKALKAQQPAKTPPAAEAPVGEIAISAKASWARLIRKVYEADPLACPKCKSPMRVIVLIDDPSVVRRILDHLGRWAPEPAISYGRDARRRKMSCKPLSSTRRAKRGRIELPIRFSGAGS